jgi:hypothetical protein
MKKLHVMRAGDSAPVILSDISARERMNVAVVQGDYFCSRRCPHFWAGRGSARCFAICTLFGGELQWSEGQPERNDGCLEDLEIETVELK